jgi:opacity protein-like surface antigen
MRRFVRLVLFLSISFPILNCGAQFQKAQFYSRTTLGINFCQIDGDQASGFNKIGYSVGFMIGQGLGKNWSYEGGFAYSTRGSRRAFDPDNASIGSFNYSFTMVDIPVYLLKYSPKWNAGVGLRTTYLISAKDKDQMVLNLQDNMRTVGMLGCVTAGYKIADRIFLQAEYMYSLKSIRNSNNGNVFFRNGVFHNNIQIGIKYALSNEN